jgi:hypothetical protein
MNQRERASSPGWDSTAVRKREAKLVFQLLELVIIAGLHREGRICATNKIFVAEPKRRIGVGCG